MVSRIDWKRAAYGGMVYVLGILAVVGVIHICLSYGLYILGDTNTALCESRGIACSQQRTNTLNLILQYWYVIPIFVGIVVFLYLMKYGLESDESGGAY